MSIILLHGSVETSTDKPYLEGLKNAAIKGYECLYQTNDRLLAVERAVNELEDNPLYNAGYGSVLNRDGRVENDGSIMDGVTGRFAAVASMGNIRYAISVAKKVMVNTKHVFLAGDGATIFAREQGFKDDNCITEEQLSSWQLARMLKLQGKELEFSPYTGLKKETDTVGCVILDDEGNLAAGSSTGGSFFKQPGRVGDTPFIGGGIYASKNCAVVCTGRGEAFIQTLTAKFIDDLIASGGTPKEVGEEAIYRLYHLTGETGGVLILNRYGQYAAVHNCSSFPAASSIDGKTHVLEVQRVR
jgi:L-asparaginase / beta-aspartyl-peptidase